MAKITIIDGNDEIELSTAPKENIKAYMVKGASGSDGISPTATVSKVDDTTTITITDKNGTTEADVLDGYNPRVDVSKSNRVTTLTKTDYYGTETVEINDGIDLTGGVPTNGVIGWTGEDKDIPNGYEFSDESFDYTFLANKPQINGVELSGNKTSNDLGITIPTPKTTKTTSDTDTYSCNYVNNIANSQNIVESGDGYIKYSDGTMICYGNYSGTTKLADYFNWCKRTEENISVTFKKEFLSAPTVIITPLYLSYVFSIMLNQIKTTGFGFTGLKPNGAIDTSVNINYIALGKWK